MIKIRNTKEQCSLVASAEAKCNYKEFVEVNKYTM